MLCTIAALQLKTLEENRVLIFNAFVVRFVISLFALLGTKFANFYLNPSLVQTIVSLC